MARIRTIKPETWEDEKLAALPYAARLLFISTWNFADDAGVIKASAAYLKAKTFPYDDTLRVSEVIKWCDALVNARMLIPISHNGESYYLIRTFRSHQIIDKRYARYVIPKEVSDEALRAFDDNTAITHSDNSVTTRQEVEGNRMEMEGKENNARSKFAPPTIEEVKIFFSELLPGQQAFTDMESEKFIDYYSANGWQVGKNKMKDWKASVRNWSRNAHNYDKSHSRPGGQPEAGRKNIDSGGSGKDYTAGIPRTH